MNEMNSEKPGVVLYHGPACADGVAAAWALNKRWPDVLLIPVNYGSEPTVEVLGAIDGRDVLVVDFSYDRETLVELSNFARTITILDHHASAERALADFTVEVLVPFSSLADPDMNQQPAPGLPIQALFDMERSGAMMAWQYAFPNTPPPPLVRYVQDRDLWRFALPNSREVNAFIGAYPTTVGDYDAIHRALMNDRTGWTVDAGRTVDRYRVKLIGEMLEHTTREMVIGGYRVPVANMWKAFASDAAGILAEESEHGFAATYFDRADGRREFSLRARGEGAPDVSKIAETYQGGGHKAAAGFVQEGGWEGEAPGDSAAESEPVASRDGHTDAAPGNQEGGSGARADGGDAVNEGGGKRSGAG